MCVCIHLYLYIDDNIDTDVDISGKDVGITLEGVIKSDMPSPFSTLSHLRAGMTCTPALPTVHRSPPQGPGHPSLAGGMSKRLGFA